jgi:hypothetical protein
MESLTPQQLKGSITAMLGANPSWPGEETLVELTKIPGQQQTQGDYVPVCRNQIKQALRLTDDEW